MLTPTFRPPSVIIALCLQVVAIGIVVFTHHFLGIKPQLFTFVCLCGLVAVILTLATQLDRWWLAIQGFFVPALVIAFSFNTNPNIFLGAFFITLLVFWNVFRTQVPLYLSSPKAWSALEQFLPPYQKDNRFTFADIGSGLGGVLIHLAKNRPDGDYYGFESAPLPFLFSWLRIQSGGYLNCRIHWKNLWNSDLAHYDVVFAYLSPAPMERLWQKAKTEMRPGTIFISSTFTVPGQSPVETVKLDDMHQSTLRVWRM